MWPQPTREKKNLLEYRFRGFLIRLVGHKISLSTFTFGTFLGLKEKKAIELIPPPPATSLFAKDLASFLPPPLSSSSLSSLKKIRKRQKKRKIFEKSQFQLHLQSRRSVCCLCSRSHYWFLPTSISSWSPHRFLSSPVCAKCPAYDAVLFFAGSVLKKVLLFVSRTELFFWISSVFF